MNKLLTHTRRPDITFRRNGLIRITARIARLLQLQPGDSINIAIHNGEYLLYALHHPIGRHDAACHPTQQGAHTYCAYSVRLCRTLLGTLHIRADSASFHAGKEIVIDNTTYIPLITRKPLC